MSRRRSLFLAASLAATLALGLCGGASAATITRSATASVPGFAESSASAACVGKERLTMAGFNSTINNDQAALPSALIPTGTALTATAFNPGDPGTITANAYCAIDLVKKKAKKKKKKKKHSAAAAKKKKKKKKKKAAPPFVPVSASSPIAGGANNATATVTCPAGKTVRAGGFDVGWTADAAYLLSSMEMISPTQLKVVVDEYGFNSEATTVTAIALCGTGPALTTSDGPVTSIGPGASATSTATCPAGKKVAFGGLREGANGFAYPNALLRASDTAVSASAFSFGPSDTIQAIAYCA